MIASNNSSIVFPREVLKFSLLGPRYNIKTSGQYVIIGKNSIISLIAKVCRMPFNSFWADKVVFRCSFQTLRMKRRVNINSSATIVNVVIREKVLPIVMTIHNPIWHATRRPTTNLAEDLFSSWLAFPTIRFKNLLNAYLTKGITRAMIGWYVLGMFNASRSNPTPIPNHWSHA